MIHLLKNQKEITAWLDNHGVEHYKLIPDSVYGYVVDVNNNVSLRVKKLSSIEVKFNHVNGFFDCAKNQLISLRGCPESVTSYFSCSKNYLQNLKGSPKIVGENFCCHHNGLINLQGCPTSVGEDFHCSENNIASLEFCPQSVGGHFYCDNNPLLGQAQSLRKFAEIYKIHQEDLVKKEKQFLFEMIKCPGNKEPKKIYKI